MMTEMTDLSEINDMTWIHEMIELLRILRLIDLVRCLRSLGLIKWLILVSERPSEPHKVPMLSCLCNVPVGTPLHRTMTKYLNAIYSVP